MLDISEAVTRAALERTESRGGHTREDFPDTDKEWGKVNVHRAADRATAFKWCASRCAEMPAELAAIDER